MNKFIEKIVQNKETIKPILINLLVSFIGSYLAISLFLNSHGMVPQRPRIPRELMFPPPPPIAQPAETHMPPVPPRPPRPQTPEPPIPPMPPRS